MFFWTGVYPGMKEEKLSYMVGNISEFINEIEYVI